MPAPNAMLFITKSGNRDDIIKFHPCYNLLDRYSVEYIPSDITKNKYNFILNRSELSEYIESILDSLRYDSEPFDEIQLTTKMFPSIMFCIQDLERRNIRTIIENSILRALNTHIVVSEQ